MPLPEIAAARCQPSQHAAAAAARPVRVPCTSAGERVLPDAAIRPHLPCPSGAAGPRLGGSSRHGPSLRTAAPHRIRAGARWPTPEYAPAPRSRHSRSGGHRPMRRRGLRRRSAGGGGEDRRERGREGGVPAGAPSRPPPPPQQLLPPAVRERDRGRRILIAPKARTT